MSTDYRAPDFHFPPEQPEFPAESPRSPVSPLKPGTPQAKPDAKVTEAAQKKLPQPEEPAVADAPKTCFPTRSAKKLKGAGKAAVEQVKKAVPVKRKFTSAEEAGLQLLSLAIPDGGKANFGKKIELPADKVHELQEFLRYASGNEQLNSALRELPNPSKAEQFLMEFTFKTRDNFMAEMSQAMAKTAAIFQIPEVAAMVAKAKKIEQTLEEMETNLKNALESCKSTKADIQAQYTKENAKHPGSLKSLLFKQMIAQLDTMEDAIKQGAYLHPNSDTFYKWGENFAQMTAAFHESVKQLGVGIKSQTKDVQQAWNEALHLCKNIETVYKISETVATIGVEKLAVNTLIHECLEKELLTPLSFKELRAIESFKNFGKNCPLLVDVPILRDLMPKFQFAKETMDTFDTLFQYSSNYEAGDVVFFEEALEHTFESKPIYSKPGTLFSSSFWKELIKIPFGQGTVWSVQPFFAGNLTHASFVNVQRNALMTAEVLSETFQNTDAVFTEATFSIEYTPDFSKIVTPDAMPMLRKIYPGKEDQAIFQDLKARFQQKVNSIIDHDKDELGQIQSDQWKAAKAILPTLSSTTRSASGELGLMQQEQMFCSEFVGRMMTKALARLQIELNTQLNRLEPDQPTPAKIKPFFNDIIPKNVAFEKVYPNRLEGFLKTYFSPKPVSSVIQLFVDRTAKK